MAASPLAPPGAALPSRQVSIEEQHRLDELRAAVNDASDAETAASEVIEHVVQQATEVMIGNHLDRLAVPYTVRCVVKEALDFVRCAFVGQDSGDVTAEHWHVDPLAPRVTVDPWARAAVSVSESKRGQLSQADIDANTAAALQAQSTLRKPGAKKARAPAEAAGVKKAASTSSSSPAPRSASAAVSDSKAGSMQGSRTSTKAKASDGTGKAKKGDATGGRSDAPSQSSTPTVTLSLEEQEYMERARAEQRHRQDMRATQERVTRQLDETKGGNFTVDGATGRVIPVSHFDGAAAALRRGGESRYAVGAPSAPAELAPVKPPPGRRGGGSSSAPAALGASSGAAAQPARVPRSRKPEASDFYNEEATYGPMIDPGTLSASGGVSVRDKDGFSKGGDVKVPKSKMTRQEYTKVASMQQMQPIDDGFDTAPTVVTSVAQPQAQPQPAARQRDEAAAGDMRQNREAQQLRQQQQDDFRSQGVASLPLHKRAGALSPMGAKEDASPRAAKRDAARKQASVARSNSRPRDVLRGDGARMLDDDF